MWRRLWLRWFGVSTVVAGLVASACGQEVRSAPRRPDAASASPRRPNILLAIADDQSFPYASAYGCACVHTPAFDRVARMGVLFRNAFAASPGCSPSRASLLTGHHHWTLKQAGTHASSFPKQFVVYPDLLEAAGYFVGYTGKGWGPGNWRVSGRQRNPVGPAFSSKKCRPPYRGISNTDYAANFADFLDKKPADRPFCFWYGGHEPHRSYEPGAGQRAGKKLDDAFVPPFLPDVDEVRSDILDYCVEIEWFDRHLGRMLDELQRRGLLEDTLIVVTADNGMPFPRAKANCYEYGIHVPLAIAWPRGFAGGRVSDDLVGFVDLAPTFLEAAGVPIPPQMHGRSLLPLLRSGRSGRIEPQRRFVLAGRERHSSSRWNNLSYPIRCLRTDRFLLIRNFRPNRWPAGHPAGYGGDLFGYYDIDASPTKSLLVQRRDDPEIRRFFHLAVEKRPEFELYDVIEDPGNLRNLAGDPRHAETFERLKRQLDTALKATGDPRVLDGGEVFESYKRYSKIRSFPPPEAP